MLFTVDERVCPGTWPRSTRCAAHTIRLPPTRLFTATLTTALSPTTRATALPAPRGALTLTHVARSPPSRDAASPLHPHLHPHQARVTVGRSIAIVGQLRHPSRSARAVDARAAASQPTEPLQPEPSRAARAGRRPSRHPSSSLRYPCIRVVAARAAAVPRGAAPEAAAARVLSPAASLPEARTSVSPGKKIAASRRSRAISALQRREYAKNGR